MSNDSDKKQKQVVSNVTTPWAKQAPYLEKGFSGAETNVLNSPRSYFPGSTVVPFSPQTSTALQMIENRAMAGSDLTRAGQNAIQQTASGGMLNANPYLNEAINIAQRPVVENWQQNVLPGVTSQFALGGRYGSNAHTSAVKQTTDQLGRQLSDISSGMAYQNFNNERGRQLQAATLAPSLAEADYADPQKLGGVGAAREGLATQQLQDQINRYNFEQEEPFDRLARYMGLIGGQYGGSSVQTANAAGGGGSSPFGNVLGGALGVGSLLGMTGAFPQSGAGWLTNLFK